MVEKFSILCRGQGGSSIVKFSIGEPHPDQHPIHFQSSWLCNEKGLQVPPHIMAALEKIQKSAQENNVPFDELYRYAVAKAYKLKGLVDNENYNKILGLDD